MLRYFIYLQYKGTNYHGWQVQPNALTVQQVLDEKLSVLLKEKIETTGAGRTDTGVHAKEFVAHFDTESVLPEEKEHFVYKMNGLLPRDITIVNVFEVKPDAHARFDAISRTYEFRIATKKDPFSYELAYFYPWELNIAAMNEACEILKAYTDFTSFSKLHTDVKTNNCIIKEAHWQIEKSRIVFTISADRFLRNMVRAIVGTMLDIGRGKINITNLSEIIEKRNRNSAGVSAPAHGLYLTKITYPLLVFRQ